MSDSKNTRKRKHFLDESKGRSKGKPKIEEEEEDWRDWENQLEEIEEEEKGMV